MLGIGGRAGAGVGTVLRSDWGLETSIMTSYYRALARSVQASLVLVATVISGASTAQAQQSCTPVSITTYQFGTSIGRRYLRIARSPSARHRVHGDG
jgi:hypothetical protein